MSRLSNNLVHKLIDWAFGVVIAIVDGPKKPKKPTVADILEAKARAEAKTRVITRE